jgi:hypothetical protein
MMDCCIHPVLHTYSDSMMDDVILHRQTIGVKYADCRAESVVEGAFDDVGWFDVIDSAGPHIGNGVPRIVRLRPSLLTGVVKLNIGDPGIAC